MEGVTTLRVSFWDIQGQGAVGMTSGLIGDRDLEEASLVESEVLGGGATRIDSG